MCGIVAYVGHQEAYPILIEGLKRLEYRGYDSAEGALLNANELNIGDFSNGVYMLRITVPQGVTMHKVVKK